jgi:molybdopterin/thiamine biosynthesis adenylyltransferase
MNNQTITIAGVGGVGSIIAENLIHMGFQNINLIDFDNVEISNLNRLVGAKYCDALAKNKKVEVIARHLKEINPFAKVNTYCNSIFDNNIDKIIALSDWVFLTTDNYASCVRLQELCFKYFVPFISAATNILVEDSEIRDIRGEVILIRIGDNLCLNCLGKIDKKELIYETHPDPEIRHQMVQKGYVRGADVKDPAVKTLNSMVSTIATDVLINQYTERQKDQFVIEYENNESPIIYEDIECIKKRNLNCHICRR